MISKSSGYNSYNIIFSFTFRVDNFVDIVALINKNNLARNFCTLTVITIFIYLTDFLY